MTTKTGALEEMLFLTRSILCTNLLTIDTLDGEALVIFLGAELDKCRVHLLVDGATHGGQERR
jgi:hypothetical protein